MIHNVTNAGSGAFQSLTFATFTLIDQQFHELIAALYTAVNVARARVSRVALLLFLLNDAQDLEDVPIHRLRLAHLSGQG